MEANFEHHFRSFKNRKDMDLGGKSSESWAGLAECAAAGEGKREGSEASVARYSLALYELSEEGSFTKDVEIQSSPFRS